MATTAKKGIGTSLAIKLGEGTCGILNSFRTMSDKYKDYYAKKEDKNIVDTAFNVVNEVGRTGAKIVTGIGKGVGSVINDVRKSEGFKEMKSGIVEAYNKLREKYSNYLTKTAEQLDKDKGDASKSKFATGFKSFINNVLQTVDHVYQGGEKVVKSAYKSISEGVKTATADIKESKAYAELMRKDAAAKAEGKDDERNADKTVEAECGV